MRSTSKTPAKTFPTLEALAMAVAAYRTRGDSWTNIEMPRYTWCHDTGQTVPNPQWQPTNTVLVRQIMTDQRMVTDEDRDRAEDIRRFFQGMVFSLLADRIKEFTKKMMNLALGEEISEVDAGALAYIPHYYAIETAKRAVNDRLSDSTRSYLAGIGERVELDSVEILKRIVSTRYECVFYTGLTSSNHRVFFAYSGAVPLEVGDVIRCKATVKRHDDAFVTTLGRVKPVKI